MVVISRDHSLHDAFMCFVMFQVGFRCLTGPFHSRSLDMIGPGVFDIDDIDSPIMQRTLLQDVRFTIDFDLIGR